MSVFQRCTVYCGSSFGIHPCYREATEEMGCLLARHGLEVVYGGGKVGLMGALANSALEAGGKVVGVIPHFLAKLERAHLGLTELTLVDDMQIRKREMLMKGDAFIALPGGLGTLDEVMEALEWTCSGRHMKPVGFLNLDGMYAPLEDMLRNAVRDGFLPEVCLKRIVVASTPMQLLAGLQQIISSMMTLFSNVPAAKTSVIAGEKPCAHAAHDALAVIVDEGFGSSSRHRIAAERFALLVANGASRLVIGGNGSADSLAQVFASTFLTRNQNIMGIVDVSVNSEAKSALKTLDLISAGSPEELRQARKRRLFEHGGQFVALPGGVAVWEEFLELFCGAQLELHTYPLGLLNSGGFFTPLLELLSNTIKAGFTEPEVMTYVVVAETPEDLLLQLRSYNPTRVSKLVIPAPHQIASGRAKL